MLCAYTFNTIEDYLIKRYGLMKFGAGLKVIMENDFSLYKTDKS